MKRLLLSSCLVATISYSQKDLNNAVLPSLKLEEKPANVTSVNSPKTLENLQGTFQYQISKADHMVMLFDDLANLIESSRLENEDVYLKQDEYVTLFIPSKSKISSDGFKKLDLYLYPNN